MFLKVAVAGAAADDDMEKDARADSYNNITHTIHTFI